jgi:DNA topoisomerase-1
MKSDTEIILDKKKIRAGVGDIVQSAKAVHLVYVNNNQTGFTRKRSGKSFTYYDGSKKIKDKEVLERIKKLVIPPAWKNVWICKLHNGHLQATGTDKLGRKQYRYHSNWSIVRNHTKFYRLYEFGKKLPDIRLEIKKNLSLPGFQREKVLAALLSILEKTNIRVGNSFYEKLYGSFGLTTLKNRHVSVNGAKISFSFKGKKGIKHQITLRSKKLANIIKHCKEITGKELFEYIDDKGEIHNIDSGMVNEFIHNISGGDFTAKDFRTWAGSVQAIIALKALGGYETESEMKEKLPQMLDLVANQLGNTRAVCKKYYIHPLITELYEKNNLEKYICKLRISNINEERTELSSEEKVLMKILKSN